MCNFNTEMCGMALAQTVVPVYTIPNMYRVQQALWLSICQIIPGIECQGGSELRSFEPVTHRLKRQETKTTSFPEIPGIPVPLPLWATDRRGNRRSPRKNGDRVHLTIGPPK